MTKKQSRNFKEIEEDEVHLQTFNSFVDNKKNKDETLKKATLLCYIVSINAVMS